MILLKILPQFTRYSNIFIPRYIYDILRYSWLLKICTHILEIWFNILRYPVRYLVKSAILRDFSRYWRYWRNLSVFHIYVKISQNWTYLKMTEIFYMYPDILDIPGYFEFLGYLFSDISGVQPLRWCLQSYDGLQHNLAWKHQEGLHNFAAIEIQAK